MRQKVVVIGHGFTSRLGIIRSLGKAGYDVTVIVVVVDMRKGKPDLTAPVDSYSRYVDKVYYCLPDGELLIKLLLDKCLDKEQKTVVIPDSDFAAAVIDRNQRRLEAHFLFPHINHIPGAVVEWMDKARQKDAALHVGLDTAAGRVIHVTSGNYEIPAGITFPCFVKPLVTLVGAKTGVGKCCTEEELRISIERMIRRSADVSVLVEEYIDIHQEYSLVGVSDGKTVCIPGILKMESFASGAHYGVAKRGKIVPLSGYEAVVERFKSLVINTGFAGIFDIDFFESWGVFFFCEMNFRCGGSGYAYTQSGVNLPQMFVQSMLGEPLEENARIEDTAVFVNERMCLDDWYSGFISTREFKSVSKNCDISFIVDKEDPLPEKAFRRMVRRKALKRMVKRILLHQ